MLEEFRALVRAGVLRVTPENEVLPAGEEPSAAQGAPEQPQARMSSEEQMNLLDRQLVEWLERRRETRGEETVPPSPESQSKPAAQPRPEKSPATSMRVRVIDLLAQKILERWDQAEREGARERLRDDVIARVGEMVLQRWDRELD
jgi:hypothetical protein